MALRDFRSVIGHTAFGQTASIATYSAKGASTSTTKQSITQASPQITPGTCSSDGAFIFAIASDGSGYWRRRSATETCQSTSAIGPSTSTSAPGGVTVTETPDLRTFKAKAIAIGKKQTIAMLQSMVNLAPTLPPCPGSSADGPNGACFYHGPQISYSVMGKPPGTFSYFGVLFNVSEMKNGRFDKGPISPDADTRFLLENAIAQTSATVRDYSFDGSVQQALAKWPDVRLQLPNFKLNPLQPTAAEMTTAGGWSKWRARGGFPLSLDVAKGKKAITKGMGLQVCASIACGCTIAPDKNGRDAGANWRDAGYITTNPVNVVASCRGANISPDGLSTTPSEIANSWSAYVAIDDAGQFYLAIIHDDPGWLQKIGAAGASFFMKLAGMLCSDEVQTQAAKNSKDPEWKAFDLWMQHWCTEWKAEQAALNPSYEDVTPVTPTPTLPTEVAPIIPIAPSLPAPSKYANCVARFHKSKKTFSIYCPIKPTGFGINDVFTNMLGQIAPEAVVPAPPPGTEKVAEVAVLPPEVKTTETEDFPLYKRWQFWAIIGGAVVAGGAGTYAIVRRRRRRAA